MSAAELDPPKGLQTDQGTSTKNQLRSAPDRSKRLFTGAAPRKVRKHAAAGNLVEEWEAWSAYLARRRSRDRLAVLARKLGPEAYGLGRRDSSRLHERLAAPFDEPAESVFTVRAGVLNVLEPLMSAPPVRADEDVAYLALSAVYRAPELTAVLDRESWWSLVESLYQLALDADGLDLTAQPVLHQLCAGELRIALACRLGEIAPLAELWAKGRRALSAGMEELLDDEGLPHCRYIALQQALVGTWTRVKLLTSQSRELPWDADCEAQFPLCVRELLRLVERGERRLFSPQHVAENEAKLIDLLLPAAVAASKSAQNRRLLETVLPPRKTKRITSRLFRHRARKVRLPLPAHHSEWAQTAILQPDWNRSSPRLIVSYANHEVRLDFTIGRDSLFAGKWGFEVSIDGAQAKPTGDWEEVCWVSDDDVDYLELEIPLEHGLNVQRQICLARRDELLFLADAVIGQEKRSIHYRGGLPLVAGLGVQPAEKTREVELSGKKLRALAMPLALGEWRVDRRCGELAASGQTLELKQQALGARLYAPLWLDLAARRRKRAFTWRELTVAEQLRIQPREVATGFRVQFGNKQWLVYRSLAERGNRTLLGHNLATEFLLARFARDGGVKPLIEIE